MTNCGNNQFMPSLSPPHISHLRAIIENYDAVICDIWGVLHNGVNVFEEAITTLKALREVQKPVILVSNAPRPGWSVQEQLNLLGVPDTTWDFIVTSGDVTRHYVRQNYKGKKVLHIGPDRDAPFFENLDVEKVSDKADCIICTGLFDDAIETPDNYRDQLQALAEAGLPMICANPDKVVERGDQIIYCAGALSDAYQSFGGTTINLGKPHAPIYEYALSQAGLNPVEPARILTIGDSLRTDLKGASQAGYGCLFITQGIHARDFGSAKSFDDKALEERLKTLQLSITGYQHWLTW
jgi:HAD superfamily hydrolase (TIGR01459 family)